MAQFKMLGVQSTVKQFGEAIPVGHLVSGVFEGRSVLALAAHNEHGQYFIVLNDGSNSFRLAGDTGLTFIQKVDGELIIEPSDGTVPFALPPAEPTGSALVITADGNVGLRLTVERDGNMPPFVIMNSLETGDPIPTSTSRRLLKGFKLLLQLEEREKPLLIGSY